ncbi:hypothetical protein CKO25_16475 [Thiocapsa imhoffii]|uniref:Cytochrome C biogenesis protein n=1 Tax=Thiocapsa imhoffii TaxID=382777 RepID=A0A9X0WK45_9GAMM|nr:cytochrome c biogenesis protein CcdA [Thiocapsa imhoffii]MBK1646212.1 hypothetical protein [Thiocapsa imhoffii]
MEWLAPLSQALSGAVWLAALAALTWGFASIWLSPCHLAGIPLLVGYLAGTPEPSRERARRELLVILAFALGVLISLVPLGVATLWLGRIAGDIGVSSNYLVAGLCLLAGLYLLDWLPMTWSGGLPQPKSRGPTTALLLGLIFGLALGPCAFVWIAPLLGVVWMQSAEGLVALPILLLALFALGHCGGVLLAAGSLHRVQRWLDTLGRVRGFGYGRAACGVLLLIAAGYLIASA